MQKKGTVVITCNFLGITHRSPFPTRQQLEYSFLFELHCTVLEIRLTRKNSSKGHC